MGRPVFNPRLLLLVFVAMLAALWPMAAQAATALPGFAVLSAAPGSGGAVTCTRSTVQGDVGSSGQMAAVVQTGCTITGAITAPVPTQVVTDFNGAYSAFANVPCGQTLTTLDLTRSLAPGVYCFPAAATATGKVLTLNGPANGIWLFKIGTAGTGALTGTDFSVVMAGGGQPCNVNWWVAQAASLTVDNGMSTPFQGTILAGAAITLVGTSGAPLALTVTGRLWAKAAVSMTDSTIAGCTSPVVVPPATCKQGEGNDGNEDADQSGNEQDRSESVRSAVRGASEGSNENSKDCDSDKDKTDKDKDKDKDKDSKDQDNKDQDNKHQDNKSQVPQTQSSRSQVTQAQPSKNQVSQAQSNEIRVKTNRSGGAG